MTHYIIYPGAHPRATLTYKADKLNISDQSGIELAIVSVLRKVLVVAGWML